MAESYYDKEFIILDKFSYLDIPYIKTWEINRGDVVVFKPWISKDKKYFLKRIIWISGDSIKISKWKVYLKKKGENSYRELDEKFLNAKNYNNTNVFWVNKNTRDFEYIVPDGEYFVMWDNRANSSDSRVCFDYICRDYWISPYIKKEQIVGKILLDLWYFDIFSFSFIHPGSERWYDPDPKWISTVPKWFSSLSTYEY